MINKKHPITRYFQKWALTIGLVFLGLMFFKNEKINSGEIQINWQDNLTGDFSFTKNWDYPEGVFKNDFGQLSCDGLCPPEIEKMQDEAGKIYSDSLKSYYKLVDTTHQFHSIQSEALVDEWAGTNLINKTKRRQYCLYYSKQCCNA